MRGLFSCRMQFPVVARDVIARLEHDWHSVLLRNSKLSDYPRKLSFLQSSTCLQSYGSWFDSGSVINLQVNGNAEQENISRSKNIYISAALSDWTVDTEVRALSGHLEPTCISVERRVVRCDAMRCHAHLHPSPPPQLNSIQFFSFLFHLIYQVGSLNGKV